MCVSGNMTKCPVGYKKIKLNTEYSNGTYNYAALEVERKYNSNEVFPKRFYANLILRRIVKGIESHF